jgi:hypothetical protein
VGVDVTKFDGDAVVLSHHDGVMSGEHHLLIGSSVACLGENHLNCLFV